MMDALPTEILTDILSRLPVNSVCCIRSVSKALLKTVDDVSFPTLHMRRRLFDNVPQVPRLVLLSCSGFGAYQRMHPLKYDGNDLLTRSKIVSEFESPQCSYTHDFVFCNLFGFTSLNTENGRSCLLVNPFKREFLMLPTTSDLQVLANSFCNHDTYGMGFDIMTNTYKIVRVSRYRNVVAAEVLVLGTSSWRELPSALPCYPSCSVGACRHACEVSCYPSCNYVATSTHGEMHWLVSEDYESVHILSFDFKNEEFYWTPHPLALKKKPNLSLFVHLLNFRGSLALVDVSSLDIEIWVLGLKNYDDKKKREWVLKYKIDMQQHPLRLGSHEPRHFKFGEWEQGIFFHEENYRGRKSIFFMDLTCMSIKSVLIKDRQDSTVYSCTDSMISLKNYGDLVEVEEQRYSTIILENEAITSYEDD
ncbi:unnamed protein product [Prunus brigantina]